MVSTFRLCRLMFRRTELIGIYELPHYLLQMVVHRAKRMGNLPPATTVYRRCHQRDLDRSNDHGGDSVQGTHLVLLDGRMAPRPLAESYR